MSQQEITDIIALKQGAIESILKRVYVKLNGDMGNRSSNNILGQIKNSDNTTANNNSSVLNIQRDQFYKKEINDRDRTIEELKQALDVYISINV
jgi:hypothetical protein